MQELSDEEEKYIAYRDEIFEVCGAFLDEAIYNHRKISEKHDVNHYSFDDFVSER